MRENEIITPIKQKDLKEIWELTKKTFSKIGTEHSRQRLIYDLLNALRTHNRKKFIELILRKINTLKSEDKNNKIKLMNRLSNVYIEYDTTENFEKMAYTIIMGIMSVESEEKGGKNE